MARSPKTPTRRRSKALVELFPHLGAAPEGPPGPNAAAETLKEMADAIHRAPTLAEGQKLQLGFIVGLLGPRSAYLAEYIHLRDRLEIAAVKGRNDPRIAAARPKEGPVGEAFAENKLVRDGDLVAVPLHGAAGPLGALVLISPRVEAPDALVEALAAQAAAAWEYARLREDTARREKDLQTALAGLKSMEKNREELLSNVSHDLKTPLTTVKAYLAMLGQGRMGEVPEKQLHAVHVAERNADRLLRMLNDVLLLSRLQTGKMQLTSRPFGLRALVTDVMAALASSGELSRVRLTLVPAPEVFVKGDRERLFEAVHNLVEHALFLCSPDGEVQVEVGSEPGLAVLTVRDDGMGLPEEDLEGLFDAFHRSRTGPGSSVGLGLPHHRQDRPAARRTGGGGQRARCRHPPPGGAPRLRRPGGRRGDRGRRRAPGRPHPPRRGRPGLPRGPPGVARAGGLQRGLGRGRGGGPGAARGPAPGDGAPRPPPLRGGRPQRAPPLSAASPTPPRRRSTSSPEPPRWPP